MNNNDMNLYINAGSNTLHPLVAVYFQLSLAGIGLDTIFSFIDYWAANIRDLLHNKSVVSRGYLKIYRLFNKRFNIL